MKLTSFFKIFSNNDLNVYDQSFYRAIVDNIVFPSKDKNIWVRKDRFPKCFEQLKIEFSSFKKDDEGNDIDLHIFIKRDTVKNYDNIWGKGYDPKVIFNSYIKVRSKNSLAITKDYLGISDSLKNKLIELVPLLEQ